MADCRGVVTHDVGEPLTRELGHLGVAPGDDGRTTRSAVDETGLTDHRARADIGDRSHLDFIVGHIGLGVQHAKSSAYDDPCDVGIVALLAEPISCFEFGDGDGAAVRVDVDAREHRLEDRADRITRFDRWRDERGSSSPVRPRPRTHPRS